MTYWTDRRGGGLQHDGSALRGTRGVDDASTYPARAPLIEAVQTGAVPVSRVNDAVLRILRPMAALGLLDNPATVQPLPEDQNSAFARSVAERSAVLLKNDGPTLPLAAGTGSIAVIGTDADVVVQGGGSSQVIPTRTVSPLAGIQARAGAGVTVTHTPGTDPVTSATLLPGPDPIPSDYLASALGDGEGLRVEYFDTPDLSGAPAVDRTEPIAGINGGFFLFPGLNAQSPHFPVQTNDHTSSIRWTGTLTAPVTGTYELAVTTNSTSVLSLDGTAVLTTGPSDGPQVTTAPVDLTAGQAYDLRLEYTGVPAPGTDEGAQLRLGWTPPEPVVTPSVQAAATAARNAQAAVVVVRDFSSEGGDKPTLDLPNGQAELIRQVAAANPRTVVVLTTGGVVQTSDWDGSVPAVLHTWFGGQEQGSALAAILFGDVNPSGRLPVTIPVDEASTPVSDPSQYPGDGLDQQFSEGIFVGYRGYAERGIEPQYPFGFGLSYTTYAYANLRTAAVPGANGAGTELQATVDVRNTGTVAGTETVQVYVGNLPTRRVSSAPVALAGWGTVTLDPGQSEAVTVTLSPESLSYWDVDRDRWRTPTGRIPVLVGASVEDIRLEESVAISNRLVR